ncbi:MAG: PIN domain-containing protein [Acidimicrobiales bacterium]
MTDTQTIDAAPSVLVLDTSALLRRYIADAHRPLVVDAMNEAEAWAASAVARTELQLGLFAAAVSPRSRDELWAAVRNDWEAMWEIPLDRRCLARATEIGARYGLSLVDALHLAAADRLPRPVRYCTFERQQIPAAAELGFEVISPYG